MLELAETGHDLRRLVQRGKRDALYDIELANEAGKTMLIPVGPISALRTPGAVADALGEAIGHVPTHLPSKPKFAPVVNCLLALRELEDTGTTPDTITRGWLAEYTRGREYSADPDTPAGRARMVGDGRVEQPLNVVEAPGDVLYVYLPAFEQYLRRVRHVDVDTRELAARLARLDFERVQVEGPMRDGKRGRRRWFWRSPAGFDAEDEG